LSAIEGRVTAVPASQLEGSWDKLERAKTHVEQLRAEMIEAGGGEADPPIPVRREFDKESRSVVSYIESLPEVRKEWGLVIGDAVHNFRCALDHLWWQLALRNLRREPTRKEARDIQFPIYGVEADFWGSRYLKHVSSDAAKEANAFQPYSTPQAGLPPVPAAFAVTFHPLAVLNSLSNTDKHQVVHVTYAVVSQGEWRLSTDTLRGRDCVMENRTVDGGEQVPWRMVGFGGPPRVDDPIFEVFIRPTGPDPDIDLKARFTGAVAMGKSWHVLRTLDAIGEWIVAILDRFDPLP
jgi:hypothetical protein